MLMMKLQEAGVESEADPLVGTDAVDAKLTSSQAKVQFRPPPCHLLCFRSGNLVWDCIMNVGSTCEDTLCFVLSLHTNNIALLMS
jgi:hypothetical protein